MRIFRHNIHVASFRLALVDLVLLAGSAALVVWYFGDAYAEIARYDTLIHVLLPSVALAVSYSLGLYGKESIADPLRLFFRSVLASVLTALASFFLLGIIFYIESKLSAREVPLAVQFRVVVLFVCVAFLLSAAGRYGFFRLFDLDFLKRRVLVLGTGERALRIEAFQSRAENQLFARAFYLPVNDEVPKTAPERTLKPLRQQNRPLREIAEELEIDEIVVATDDRRGLPIDDILDAKLSGWRVTDYLAFYEREARRIDLDSLSPSWFIFSDGFSAGTFDLAGKRLFDLVVSVLVLLLALPIMLLTAILIRLDSKGPVFYRQVRVGQHGRPFTLLKFRSMRVDAEKEGPQWAKESDNRITRIGAIIRLTRIDELPQVICVLRGEMSFIGPRPERPFFVDSLVRHVPYYGERHRMKPGITGWAQVNYPYGASIADAKEKLSYDLYYTKNFSLFLDILILLQTIRVVLIPEGVR